MAKYNWTFANVGGVTRVKIQSGEDIRHLGELDEKLWTVLSCPTTGLEIDSESLRLMDSDGDGKLRVKEVQQAAAWLCSVLRDPEVLLAGKDELQVEDIADEGLRAVAEQVINLKIYKSRQVGTSSENLKITAGETPASPVASMVRPGDRTSITAGETPASPVVSPVVRLADVEAAIAGVSIEAMAAPEAPFAADVMAAYKAKKDEYAAYFEQEKLAKLGLANKAGEDACVPGMTQEAFLQMGAQIADYEAAAAAAADANTKALAAAQAQYQPLRKLLLLTRDFYRLLRNFVTFEDFYRKDIQAIFQAGTLVIDQRACQLCLRVSDMGKQNAQAGASGMYLVYCDCESKKLGQKMQIVAAMTVGDIRNLTVGKNALFYDNQGNDWDAVVTKIIDNPISISQAFWSPYRKFGAWVTDLINKSAAEKDSKGFADLTAKVQEGAKNTYPTCRDVPPAAGEKPKVQAFDIAKFAGIFAAIGMAVGYIGAFFTSVVGGFAALKWWQDILAVLGILLVISGPSMFLAWTKLRKRNLAPVLNANGWAINAEVMVSVVFGNTLTTQAQFPLLQLVDPTVKKKMPRWAKWLIGVLVAAVVAAGVWAAVHFCCADSEEPAAEEVVAVEVVDVETAESAAE